MREVVRDALEMVVGIAIVAPPTILIVFGAGWLINQATGLPW